MPGGTEKGHRSDMIGCRKPMSALARQPEMSDHIPVRPRMKSRTVTIGLAFLGLIAMLLVGLPALFRIDALSAAVLHHVEQRLGHAIEVATMRVTLVPRIGVELIDVRVLDASTTARLFSAGRMHLVVQALPLLRGELIGERLLIEQPHVELHRDEAGRWALAHAAAGPTSEPAQIDNPLAFVARVRNVLLTDGRLTLTDYSGGVARHVQLLTGLQAIVAEGVPGRTATVHLQGEIAGDSATATVGLDGMLIQTRVETSETLSAASPYPVQFDGTVRIASLDLRQVGEWVGGGAVMEGWHGSVGFSGRFSLIPRAVGYDLIVPEWTADLRGVLLQGNARVIGLSTGTPVFSAILASSPLPLRQWLDRIPQHWLPAGILSVVNEHDVEGLLTLRTAAFSGSFNAASPVDVTAELQISEGRFRTATQHPRVQGLSATMFYDRQELRVVDVQGEYGPIHLSGGTMVVTNIGVDPSVDAHVTGVVQADGLIALGRMLNVPYFESFFTGFEQAQGEIAIAAHMTGRPMSAESLNLVDADISLYDVGLRIPTVPVPIHKLNGRLVFSSGTFRLDALTGHVGPAQLEAQGSLTIAAGVAYHALHVQLTAEGADLALLLPAAAGASRPKLAGPLRLNATVSGPMQKPRITGRLELEETALGIPDIVTKPEGAPASIEFEGVISSDRVLLVRRLDLLMSPIRLTGEGHLDLTDDWDFEARVATKPVSLAKLPRGVSVGAVRSGLLDATLVIRGHADDRSSWESSGRVRLKKGLIEPEGSPAMRDVALTAVLDHRDIDIQELALTTGGSDLRARGSVANWLESPEATFVIESSELNLGLLQRAGRVEQSPRAALGSDVLKSWSRDGRLTATVFAKAAFYDRVLFTNVSCRLRVQHGVLTIDQLSADTDDGHLDGRVLVQPPDRRVGHVKSAFRLTGLPVDRVLSFVATKDVLTGWMSIDGKIEAELEPRGLVLGSLTNTRPIRLILEDGRILKVPVISKLLSVMNLPAMLQGKVDLARDGLPFDQLRAVFSVANGIVAFQEIALASPILKISGAGHYDFVADHMDMVLATSPLGSYSDLLKRVPLFGRIFAGEREGLDTAVFEVKGPSVDPSILYLPAESFSRGVKGTAQFALDVLRNTLMSPKAFVDEFLTEKNLHEPAIQETGN